MIAVDFAQFEDLQGRLRAVFTRLADQLPVDTAGYVDEFIDSSEFGLALETMSEVLAESDGRIDSETLAMVRSLAEQMGLAPETHERLAPLVDRGTAG